MTDTPSSTTLTPDEQQLVRRSAFAALALVSRSDPGFLDMFKESMAGSRALAQAPPEVQSLLREGGFPMPPTGSPQEVEQTVLSDLGQAMTVLRAKAPEQADGYRDVILTAVERVAGAADGVAPEEQAMIERVRSALSGAAPASPAAGGFPADAPPLPGR